jgi:hypothetical protein
MDVVGVKKCFMTSLKGDLFFPPNNSSVFSYNDISQNCCSTLIIFVGTNGWQSSIEDSFDYNDIVEELDIDEAFV